MPIKTASWMRPAACLLAASSAWPLVARASQNLYASPTVADGSGYACTTIATACSLNDVRTKARQLNTNMTGNLIVNLLGGTYWLSSTFTLNATDAGTNGYDVIYQANSSDPNQAPVFSGGVKVIGWEYDSNKGLWEAYLPDSSPSNLAFRQMYVNGVRAIRARQPNASATTPYLTAVNVSSAGFKVNATDVPSATLNSATEITWLAHWRQLRTRVGSWSTNSGVTSFLFTNPEQSDPQIFAVTQNDKPGRNTYYYFENNLAFLDDPGEWFLDGTSQLLYYKPRAGENMSTATVIAPKLDTLMNIDGSGSSTLPSHIQVKGITFAYSNWTDPNNFGYFSSQAALQLHTNNWSAIPGALRVANFAKVRIEGNTFKSTGAHGLLLTGKLDHTEVIGNTFTDLSAGGVVAFSNDNSYGVIANNLVEKVGRYYEDAVGITVSNANHARIELNEVRDTPYTGISLGWSWVDTNLGYNDNYVQYNHVHDVMKLLDDGAAIYTLGYMSGSSIHDNRVATILPSPYNGQNPITGIYLDNGSVGKTVEHNVADNTSTNFYAQPGYIDSTGNHKTYDNTFTRNYYNVDGRIIGNLGTGPGYNHYLSDNVLVSGAWNADAQTVIAGAGLVTNQALIVPPTGNHASASSSDTGYLPNNVVNGSTEDAGWQPVPQPVGSTVRPWWEVNLVTPARIKKVEIVGHAGDTDAVLANRRNFEVWASNTADMSQGHIVLAAVADGVGFPNSSTWTYVVPNTDPKNKPYQYLAIVKTAAEGFYLSEVRVFR